MLKDTANTLIPRNLSSTHYFDIIRNMETKVAVDKLAALAQETRLRIFRLLVTTGPAGLNAGAIAEALALAPATLSFHIAQLARAGLVSSRQESRFIYYAASFTAMDDLIAFLTDNCCQGGDACLPKAAAVATMARRRAKPGKEKAA
jgi:ArsR family transcriptional regulator